MKAPAFQFYPKDFLVDTASMTPEQVGAYWRLCCYAWVGIPGCQQGEIPASEVALAKLAGVSLRSWRRIAEGILNCFVRVESGNFSHKRLLAEVQKQGNLRAKRAEAAACRWNANALQVQSKTDALQSASASSTASVEEKKNHAPKKRARNEFADAAQAIFSEVDAIPPSVGLLQKWRKELFKDNSEWMLRTLQALAPRGVLGRGEGYLFTVLQNAAAGNGSNGRASPPKKLPTGATQAQLDEARLFDEMEGT